MSHFYLFLPQYTVHPWDEKYKISEFRAENFRMRYP